MRVSIIAAVAANGVIGRDNHLPWRLSADLKRFRELTMGHTIVMGRKTWDSIGRALPGRRSIVITRKSDWRPDAEGVLVAHSLDEAIDLARDDTELFIIGGAEIYQQALRRADRLYLTRILAEVAGDVRFPDIDEVEWTLRGREAYEPDDKNEHAYRFEVYDRVTTV